MKFYFEKPVSWATSARVLGEPGLQGKTTYVEGIWPLRHRINYKVQG